MGDKTRQMEDEMSRFEAEISGKSMDGFSSFSMMVPHQVKSAAKRTASSESASTSGVLSAKPTLYAPKPSTQSNSNVDFLALQNEVERKLKKLKEKVTVPAELAISQGKASSALQSFGPDDHRRRGKNKKLLRTAGGQVWEDLSLADWSEDDFRMFCGDLGNDVTDELLTRTFNKYPSFLRARVVRDKRTNKTKGYGFISFKDPADFTRAMKEMNEKLEPESLPKPSAADEEQP